MHWTWYESEFFLFITDTKIDWDAYMSQVHHVQIYDDHSVNGQPSSLSESFVIFSNWGRLVGFSGVRETTGT